MRGNKGKMMFGFKRTKIGLPIYILSCSLFFFAGFYGSMLFSQDIAVDTVPRVRLMEERETMIALPHGETGESDPSPIPFQASHSNYKTNEDNICLFVTGKCHHIKPTCWWERSSFYSSICIIAQVLSWKPRAFYFPNFATAEQCENIIKKAKSQLRPSKLALRKGETEENTKGVRTSSGTFMSASEDPTGTLKFVEEKIARATMIPRDHGEDFNVLRYEIGQKYASHYDAFSPSEYGPQKSQRVASFLLYLSDVEQGGETMFPYENGENMDIVYNYEDCIGLKVKPRQGDGLLFYSLYTNGTIDPTSLHGSCPVIKGEKYVATKWIRDQIQKY